MRLRCYVCTASNLTSASGPKISSGNHAASGGAVANFGSGFIGGDSFTDNRVDVPVGTCSSGLGGAVFQDQGGSVTVQNTTFARNSGPSARLHRQERRDRVRAALEALPERDREVLVLRYLEDLSTADTAAGSNSVSPGSSGAPPCSRYWHR